MGAPGREDFRSLPTVENRFAARRWMRSIEDVLDSRELGDTDWFDALTKTLREHSQWHEHPPLAEGGWSAFFKTQGKGKSGWCTHKIFAISEKTKPAKEDYSCDEELPHISSLLEDSAKMDDRATRSEILCAAHFMIQRLLYRARNGLSVHPV